MKFLPFSASSITSMVSAIVLGTVAHKFIPGIDLRTAFFLVLALYAVFTLEGIESELRKINKKGSP